MPDTYPPQTDDERRRILASQTLTAPRTTIPQLNAIPAPPMPTPQPSSPNEMRPLGTDPSPTVGANLAKPQQSGWQKLEHGLGRAANIAGDVLSPAVTSLIPGSDLYKEREQGRQAKLAGEGARTAQAQEATAASQAGRELVPWTPSGADQPVEVPQRSLGGLEQAQERAKATQGAAETRANAQEDVANTRAQAEQEHNQFLSDLANKKEAASPFALWAANPAVYDAFLKAQQEGKIKPGVMSPYAAVRLADYAYKYDPRLLPFAQGAMQNISQQLGIPLGSIDISTPPAGQPHDQAGNAIGLAQPEAPTGATRTAGQFADKALAETPRIRQEIGSMANEIGPLDGRKARFLVGYIGSSGDPQFDEKYSKLRTDMTFLTSNAARFHLNSVKSVDEFLKLADTGKASAASLNGFIDSMEQWAKTASNIGGGNQPTGGAGGPISFQDWQNQQKPH